MSMVHAVLGVLNEGDRHAYDIAGILADRIPAGPYNSGQVHQALDRIEREGWATSHEEKHGSRLRRVFSITAAGRKEFMSWLPKPVSGARPVRDEMVVKVVFLGRHDMNRLVNLLEQRRREHIRRLAYLQQAGKRQPGGDDADRLPALARDAARFREEAELRWVEHCLSRLKIVPQLRQPPASIQMEQDADPSRRRPIRG
jgi:DNA-binding PadR family transcriptional regulator